MKTMVDYPLVRTDNTCPRCLGVKASGLLLCWPCHHEEKDIASKFRAAFENEPCGDYSPHCEELIEEREEELESMERTSTLTQRLHAIRSMLRVH
jgi:hypothetical protein